MITSQSLKSVGATLFNGKAFDLNGALFAKYIGNDEWAVHRIPTSTGSVYVFCWDGKFRFRIRSAK